MANIEVSKPSQSLPSSLSTILSNEIFTISYTFYKAAHLSSSSRKHLSSVEIFDHHNIKSESPVWSTPATVKMDEAKGNHKTLTGSIVHVTYKEMGAESLVRNTGTN